MASHHSGRRLALRLIGFILLGVPIVGYLWVVLSDLLAGKLLWGWIGVAVLLLLVFLRLLRTLAQTVQQLEPERAAVVASPPPPSGAP